MPFDDLEVGLQYKWEVIRKNSISYKWDLGNGTISTTKAVIFNADKEEHRKVCVNVSVNGWINISKCFDVNIKKPFNPSRNPSDPPTSSMNIQYSGEDEVIDGINYGKLIKFGNQLWLSKDVAVTQGISGLIHQCPIGTRYFLPKYLNKFIMKFHKTSISTRTVKLNWCSR